jgi:hypothetical protein
VSSGSGNGVAVHREHYVPDLLLCVHITVSIGHLIERIDAVDNG